MLSPPVYRENLDDKLDEELAEYRQSRDHTELMDIVEVIQAILEAEGVDWAAFERDRAARRAERGAFRPRIWLRSVLGRRIDRRYAACPRRCAPLHRHSELAEESPREALGSEAGAVIDAGHAV